MSSTIRCCRWFSTNHEVVSQNSATFIKDYKRRQAEKVISEKKSSMKQLKKLKIYNEKENEKIKCHSGIEYDDLIFTDTRV